MIIIIITFVTSIINTCHTGLNSGALQILPSLVLLQHSSYDRPLTVTLESELRQANLLMRRWIDGK